MPNLVAHIGFGIDCLGLEEESLISNNLGSFLLGCCSPDVRIITKMSRDKTHFVPISNKVIGTGTHNLFKENPNLLNRKSLNSVTKSFLAGYILHLVADETWIIDMYRPFFGNRKVFPNKIIGNIMDRAMQLDMDRETHLFHENFSDYVNELAINFEDIDIDFISNQSFKEFTDTIKRVFSNTFDWGRLIFMIRRQYPDKDSKIAESLANDFINNIPNSLDDLYLQVPKSAIKAYRSNIISSWQLLIKEYLL